MDMGKLNSVVFLDLSKAFDTVDHSILLKKLSLYGISQESLIWFSSYLSNRKQQCFVNGHLSVPRTITCGVPLIITNSDLSNIGQWLLANKLSLNVAKTEHVYCI